ncbi:MAG TPA: hypothetical protein VGW33_12375 [Terriglobia bacterium]|nr:hypothetical protein [Terriglobia bacterium]
MKRTLNFALAAVVFAATLTLMGVPNALAEEESCSNGTLQGSYGASITGTVAGLPLAELDLVSADGKGNFTSGTGTLSFNGSVSTFTFTGTYTINADCSGSASLSNGVTQNLVIKADGSEVMFIGTNDPNAQVTGAAKRVQH